MGSILQCCACQSYNHGDQSNATYEGLKISFGGALDELDRRQASSVLRCCAC